MFPKRFKLFNLFVLFYWLINCTKLDILYHILFPNYWQKLRNTEKPRKTTRNQQLRNPTGGKTEEELCSFFPILLSLCTVTSKISSTRLTWFKYTYITWLYIWNLPPSWGLSLLGLHAADAEWVLSGHPASSHSPKICMWVYFSSSTSSLSLTPASYWTWISKQLTLWVVINPNPGSDKQKRPYRKKCKKFLDVSE